MYTRLETRHDTEFKSSFSIQYYTKRKNEIFRFRTLSGQNTAFLFSQPIDSRLLLFIRFDWAAFDVIRSPLDSSNVVDRFDRHVEPIQPEAAR